MAISAASCAAWTDVYDLVLIDKIASPEDGDVIVADLAIFDEDWITHFHGVDTVVHLAANGDDSASWDELIGPNLDALANVFHAAALAGVERVIFASSNHVMGDYRHVGDGPITVDMAPMPDGPYGVTKLVGERMGRSLARAFDLTFIAIRIGWVQDGKNRPETMPTDWDRRMWLSNADLVRLFDCAVEAEIEDRLFVLVNGYVAIMARAGISPTPPSCSAFFPKTTPTPRAACRVRTARQLFAHTANVLIFNGGHHRVAGDCSEVPAPGNEPTANDVHVPPNHFPACRS